MKVAPGIELAYQALRADSHHVILQGLDQTVPSPHSDTGEIWYGIEAFEGTEDLWNRCPLIFLPDGNHLSWEEYLKNPLDTLEKHNARIVGINAQSWVVREGSKRLESFPLIWDEIANSLIKSGELGISTDFNCMFEGDHLSGKVNPNYIAVFPIESQNEQNDLGARFLNHAASKEKVNEQNDRGAHFSNCTPSAPGGTMESETKQEENASMTIIGKLLDYITSKPAPIHQNSTGTVSIEETNAPVHVVAPPAPSEPSVPAVPVEFLGKLDTVTAEKEAVTTEKNTIATELEAARARIAEFEQQEQARKDAEQKAVEDAKEGNWEAVKLRLPAGMVHAEEDVKKLKSEYFENPGNFLMNHIEHLNHAESVIHANSAKGQGFSNTPQKEDDAPIVIGSYNAATKKFEV